MCASLIGFPVQIKHYPHEAGCKLKRSQTLKFALLTHNL